MSADLTPLELPQIAAIPDREGYEVALMDAMIHEDYGKGILETRDGALLFARSRIRGCHITHGAEVARMVRTRLDEDPAGLPGRSSETTRAR